MDETQTVDTEIELDVPADDAWPAVATPAGLAAWLAPGEMPSEILPYTPPLTAVSSDATRCQVCPPLLVE